MSLYLLRKCSNSTFKISILVIAILLIAGIVFFSLLNKSLTPHKNSLNIALGGTLSGDIVPGRFMARGAQLYLDEINRRGGVNGKQVKLHVFDDRGNVSQARKNAVEIVKTPQLLAVIGHNFSNLSIAVGKVYRKYGVPAVDAASTSDAVTKNNEWYFSVVPNNKSFGAYLANYARNIMGHDKAIAVYDPKDDYSVSLFKHFELLFTGLGGRLEKKLKINVSNNQADDVISYLLENSDPGKPCLLVLSMQIEQTEDIIVSLRRSGLECDIIGGDTLVGQSFTDRFNKYPEEVFQPGYFTDNIYASTPLIFDVAGFAVNRFHQKYVDIYDEEPQWQAVYGYNAAKLLVAMLKDTNVTGKSEYSALERRKIRDALAKQVRGQQPVKGIMGDIYLNNEGSVTEPVFIGLYKKRYFISALTQFKPIRDGGLTDDLDKQIEGADVSTLAGRYVKRKNIVYVGISFNEINNIDLEEQSYDMDFYLWFRFYGKGDYANIEFTNALNSIRLGKPITDQEIAHGGTYQLYHVKGKFTADFNLKNYPFDKQNVYIRFRHSDITKENLIYVVDTVGMKDKPSSLTSGNELGEILRLGNIWKARGIRFFQEGIANESTFGDPQLFDSKSDLEYSTIQAGVVIERESMRFIVKHLLPLFFVICLAYLGFYLPSKQFSTINTLLSGSLLTIAFFHLSLSNSLPGIGYYVALDYVFYVLYVLILLGLLITLINWRSFDRSEKLREQNEGIFKNSKGVKVSQQEIIVNNRTLIDKYWKFRRKMILVVRVLYPVVLLVTTLVFVFVYDIYPLDEPKSSSTEVASSKVAGKRLKKQAIGNDEHVLKMASWQVDSIKGWKTFLEVFKAEHPEITVKFNPTMVSLYDSILPMQLENNIAADLLNLRSGFDSWPLFKLGYLKSLDALPGLEESFDKNIRRLWSSKDGKLYAVPLQGVMHGVYYNTSIFKKLNLDIPETWEELLKTAKKLQDAGYIPFANGTKDKWSVTELVFMNIAPNFIGGRKGRLEYENGKRCFNDQYVVSAFQGIMDIAPLLPKNHSALTTDSSIQLFIQGKAAMYLGGSWSIKQFESEVGFQWSIFAVPAPAGQPRTMVFHPDAGIGINAASQYKQQARVFLAWLMEPETMALFEKTFPGFYSLSKNKSVPIDKYAATFLSLSKQYDTDQRWLLPQGVPDAYSLMYEGTIAVINGKMTPTQAADNLQSGLGQWYEPAQTCHLKNALTGAFK